MKLTLNEVRNIVRSVILESSIVDHEYLASEYVRIRNAASKEYKAAFKAIGACMWNGDDAQSLKSRNREYIANRIQGFDIDTVRKMYPASACVPFPLTVMDSYPEARKHRAELELALSDIQARYQKEWDRVLNTYHG